MRFYAALVSIALFVSATFADVQVRGYTRKDGTYVAPHVRSSPNSTKSDNWSTKGNVNPYTGKEGTRLPESSYAASPSTSLTSTAGAAFVGVTTTPIPESHLNKESRFVTAEIAASSSAPVVGSAPTLKSTEVVAMNEAERDRILLVLLQKITLLERRIDELEKNTDSRLDSLTNSTQKALNDVSQTIARSSALSESSPQKRTGLPALEKSGPSAEQWMSIKRDMTMGQVRVWLGEPNRIYKGALLTWEYSNGQVTFYDSGTVLGTEFR